MSYRYIEAAKILCSDPENFLKESAQLQTILEDGDSPVTRSLHEKLYKSIIDKKHIDFGSIPQSKGNIRNYSGYPNMVETLNVINSLAESEKNSNVKSYVKTVQDSIHYIEELSSTYEKGFTTKTEYVAMEYNSYVFFCVEATTAILYSFVDYIKSPDSQMMEIKLKNTKLRADEFYFEQLKNFNRAQDNLGIKYRKMLEEMCNKGGNNFIGTSTAIGIGVVIAAAMAVVPITREVIYQIYNFRGKISECLDLQAQFLDMNKVCVQSNDALTADKKRDILKKQEKLAKDLRKLADVIRVKSSKSIQDSQREIQKDNKSISVDKLKDEVSNSPFEIL